MMTKRKSLVPLILALSLMTAGAAAAAADEADVEVELGGESVVLSQELVLHNGRTMIEAGDAAKLINGGVEEADGLITLVSASGLQLVYKPGTNQVKVGPQWMSIDQGAIVNDRSSYLPLRWTLEALGYQVDWDAAKRTVHVRDTKSSGAFVPLEQTALTAEQRAFVEKVKQQRGVHRLGDLYVIARGESANPGYGLQIEKQQLAADRLLVHVRLTKPEPGLMYPQVVSYPYLLGKADLPGNTTIQFVDAATGEPLFANADAKNES